MKRCLLSLFLLGCAGEPYPLIVAARAPGWVVTNDARYDTNNDYQLKLTGDDADQHKTWLRSPKATREIGDYQARDPSGRYLVHKIDGGLALVDTQTDARLELKGASKPRLSTGAMTFTRGDKLVLLSLKSNSQRELKAAAEAFPSGETAVLKLGDKYEVEGVTVSAPVITPDYVAVREGKAISIGMAKAPCADRLLYSYKDSFVVSCGTDVLRFSAREPARVIVRNVVAPFFESPAPPTRLMWLPTWDGEVVYDAEADQTIKLGQSDEFVALFDDAILLRRDTTLLVKRGKDESVVIKDVAKARGHYARRLDCWSNRCTWLGNQPTSQPDGSMPMQNGAYVWIEHQLVSLRSLTARPAPGTVVHVTDNGELLLARDALDTANAYTGPLQWIR